MNHSDLIKRIQDSARAAGMPPDIVNRIPYEWRDFAEGYEQERHYEGSITLAKAKQIFRKIFGGKKK